MLIPFHKISSYFVHGPPRGVIHVGAHKAEELEGYHSIGVKTIAWIEANPGMFGNLMARTAGHSGSTLHWFASHEIDNCSVNLNIANNGESSSLLELGTHKIEHPHIHYVDKQLVPAQKIDTFLDNSGFQREVFDFVNIDVQGSELLTLKGMTKQLSYVKYLYLEVNEKILYVGCPLMKEIDVFLDSFGFERKITEMTVHGWGDAFYAKR